MEPWGAAGNGNQLLGFHRWKCSQGLDKPHQYLRVALQETRWVKNPIQMIALCFVVIHERPVGPPQPICEGDVARLRRPPVGRSTCCFACQSGSWWVFFSLPFQVSEVL